MTEKIKVGIVGCGAVARKRHIPAFRKLKQKAELRAVCDINEELARQVATKFGIPKVYSDFKEMLKREDLELIDICIPPQLRLSMVLEAAGRGCHILLEKPMALTVSDCDEMIKAVQKNRIKLCVVHNELFYPPVLKARELVAKGTIGQVTGMRLFISEPRGLNLLREDSWLHRLKGGVLEESVAHPVYLSLPFTGAIKKVKVWAGDYLEHPWAPFDEFRIELEGEKANSSIISSYSSNIWAGKLDLFGTEGTLHIDLQSMLLLCNENKNSLKPLSLAGYSLGIAFQIAGGIAINAFKLLSGRIKLGHDILIERFIDSILYGKPPPVTAEEARETVKVTEMIIQKLHKKYQAYSHSGN